MPSEFSAANVTSFPFSESLFNVLPVGIVYQDNDGSIINANSSAESILGLTADQMRGVKSIDPRWRAIHPDGAPFTGETHPTIVALKTQKPVLNEVMGVFNPIRDDFIWISVSAFPINNCNDGIFHGVYALFEDITERKLAENKLHLLQFTIDHAPDAVYGMTREGQFLYVNQAASQTLGYSADELLNMGVADIDPNLPFGIPPEMAQATENAKTALIESEHRTRDGRIIPVEINASHFEHEGKKYLCSFVRDISERKHAEHALEESVRNLEEKELSKTRFLAAAGHDLRQPITAASLFLHALKLTSPTQQQSELIAQLSKSMTTFSDLLELLLDISKFDAGLIKPQFTSTNMAEMFNWLEQNFAQIALDKQLSFRFYFPSRPLIVRTDVALLKSVLMNLVTNAIKYTSHRGILVSTRVHGDQVLLQVWDTGIGIDEANLTKIFDEFYQIANQERNREAGLGLGLSICKRALTVLGSEITCRSRLGHGTVFSFSIPLDDEYQVIDPFQPSVEGQKELIVLNKRIVILEDDEQVASGLVSLFQSLGAEVRHFNNAEEALRQDDIASVDFFIVDYMLGGELSGINFLLTLQQRQKEPIRAVIITGETSSQFVKSVKDSPWPILYKPINIDKLAICISSFADAKEGIPATHETLRGIQ